MALKTKRRIKGLLLFLPNMVRLCGGLMTDARVPKVEKTLVAAALVYAISPLDFIPDLLPFIGQVDDAYLIALTVLRLINRSDAQVVRAHWHGGGDIVDLAESLTNVAPLILPKRISRVLSSKVDSPTLTIQNTENDEKRATLIKASGDSSGERSVN